MTRRSGPNFTIPHGRATPGKLLPPFSVPVLRFYQLKSLFRFFSWQNLQNIDILREVLPNNKSTQHRQLQQESDEHRNKNQWKEEGEEEKLLSLGHLYFYISPMTMEVRSLACFDLMQSHLAACTTGSDGWRGMPLL